MKISKNFYLEEKVPESIYKKYGESSIKFLDPRSIILSQKLRDYLDVPTPLPGLLRAGVIDEDPSHRCRGKRQEVRPAVDVDDSRVHQLQEGLMGQRGRFDGMAGTLLEEFAPRHGAELVVENTCKLLRRTGIPLGGFGNG